MTGAPQGACSGRAPPSLRSPPAITTIHLPGGTYRKIWTQLVGFGSTRRTVFAVTHLPDGPRPQVCGSHWELGPVHRLK